jgi:outer membrane protein OmpA-like peptidoglycan-associated protein
MIQIGKNKKNTIILSFRNRRLREIFIKKSVIFVLFCAFLQGCASSDVSRGAADEADQAHLQTNNMFRNMSKGSLINEYQNTSQTAKGIMLGGAIGAAAGHAPVGLFPGLLGGAIFGGAIGAYIDSHTTLVDKLENRGVRVYILGDQVMLVLSSATFFEGMTPVLRPESYSTLDKVAELISSYPNITTKISAYATMAGTQQINLALSQQQADTIAKYLWRKGVNTRMLYSVGYGDANRVVKEDFNSIASDNYRVEITLEKLPV